MSKLVEVWMAGAAPARSGLYRADGAAWEIEVDGPELSRFELGRPLDLEVLLTEDPDGVTVIDLCHEAELDDGSGYMCCGDGALGADGFFARLDRDRNILWVVFMTGSNPFERIALDGSVVHVVNNLGNSVTVDLTRPEFAETSEPG